MHPIYLKILAEKKLRKEIEQELQKDDPEMERARAVFKEYTHGPTDTKNNTENS